MLLQEPLHLRTDLQVRDIRVQIQPIDALDLQRDMAVEDITDVHNTRHAPQAVASGPALPARNPRSHASTSGEAGRGACPLPPIRNRRTPGFRPTPPPYLPGGRVVAGP